MILIYAAKVLRVDHEVVNEVKVKLDEVQKMIHELQAAMNSRNENTLQKALNEVTEHNEMEWCAVRDAPRVHTMMTLVMMGKIHP